jgi:uncharacterized small protein (TIGR04563 family)
VAAASRSRHCFWLTHLVGQVVSLQDTVTLGQVLGIIRFMSEDMNKQSLYFPQEMLKEIEEEAKRLERSKSWVVAHAWKLAHDKIKRMSASDPDK